MGMDWEVTEKLPELEIEVTRVQGKCNAGLRVGDRFAAGGTNVVPQGHDRSCHVALASVVLNAGRVVLSGDGDAQPVYVSCMDPGTGEGGNVVFAVVAPGLAGGGASGAGDTRDAGAAGGTARPIFFQPVEITGSCPAGLTNDHRFTVKGMTLVEASGGGGSPHGGRAFWPDTNVGCLAAMAHWLPSLWQLQGGKRFFAHASCPGCTTGRAPENRVVFLGGHADKWELCDAISQYLRTVRAAGENEAATAFKRQALELQDQGDFEGARRCMAQALAELAREHS